MTTARTTTRQRREKFRRDTVGFKDEQLPLQRQITHAICLSVYNQCACADSLGKPACERMEGAARHIIDKVRHHDMRARGEI
jgi:hypothetical protein